MVLPGKRLLFGDTTDPWQMVLKVHCWAKQLKEGTVQSRAEVARREGITPTRVSQLWPLRSITGEQVKEALRDSVRRDVSLRTLIRFARSNEVKFACSGGRMWPEGN